MKNTPKICVVGSSNYDLVANTDRIPQIGETIIGNTFLKVFGGKGANQAVTAAKLGADVTMITKLGTDSFGQETIQNYKNCKMSTEFIYTTDKASSGIAAISVDKEGGNSIIVIPGANNLLTVEDVEKARKTIAASSILICQLEIPLDITKKAMQIAKEEGVTTIFNPSPAPAFGIPTDLYELTDIICPNETETELLTGIKVNCAEDAEKAGRILLKKGVKKVVMTLGEKGSMVITEKSVDFSPCRQVKAVDTTGAGDCFLGSYAYFSSIGFEDAEVLRRANYVASISVQTAGAQPSLPLASDLPDEIMK